tara:strand:+ start:406 stop:840 length:435 start_codon:yes stop_codon:yes gene_type:complete
MIHNLVQLSNKISNISSINLCKHFVNRYNGDDWKQFINYKDKIKYDDMGYSKIKLPLRTDYKQLYLLEWEKNALTNKHKHYDEGCLFKILEGSLKESLFDKNQNQFRIMYHGIDNISYLNNKNIYHSIKNNNNDKSYSLHIYSK